MELEPQPEIAILRAPEVALIMLRGRMGGIGQRFNLGETTVTRCAVRLGDSIGHGYVLGRDKEKALLIARFDALLQDGAWAERLEDDLLAPLERSEAERRGRLARRAAATKVEFFTLVRGED